MQKELELWQFIAQRLAQDKSVMLLVVAESSGSSPGRQGYKMAVASDGELIGSIGGGVMEVKLVDESRRLLSVPSASAGGFREQVHRKNSPHASGMICSGKQTVIFYMLSPSDFSSVSTVVDALENGQSAEIQITREHFSSQHYPPANADGTDSSYDPPTHTSDFDFFVSDTDFRYTEILGVKNQLYIIGGGHCALALSELMSRMDFHISIFDDRPQLNTIAKNEYAHEIKIVDSYERIGDHIASGRNGYVVVMTLGYKTDEIVIRDLIEKEFKYFGVLGSKAKMATMLRSLRNDGISEVALSRIRTPIGLPINSRTPEEIAVSIAAEIISVKNAEP